MAKTALAIAAISMAAAGGYQSYASNEAQKKGLKAQKAAQRQAEIGALRTEEKNQESINKAKGKTPDIATLLAEAQNMRPPATQLTGPTGLPTSNYLGM